MASGNGTNLWHNWVGLAALNLGEWSGETQPGGCSVGTRAGAPRRGRMEEACARWQGTQICEKTSAVGQPCSTVRVLAARSPGLLGRAERSSPNAASRRAEGAGLDGAERAITTIPRGITLQQIQSLVAQGWRAHCFLYRTIHSLAQLGMRQPTSGMRAMLQNDRNPL